MVTIGAWGLRRSQGLFLSPLEDHRLFQGGWGRAPAHLPSEASLTTTAATHGRTCFPHYGPMLSPQKPSRSLIFPTLPSVSMQGMSSYEAFVYWPGWGVATFPTPFLS